VALRGAGEAEKEEGVAEIPERRLVSSAAARVAEFQRGIPVILKYYLFYM